MSRLHPISGCDNEKRQADVIFVHGLGGDAFATWKSGENASWPHWLGEDVPEVGVWSLGYAASPSKWARVLSWISFGKFGDRDSGHAMALPDRAAQVLDQLILDGLGERPIFFICHSLGGLLVKQILRTSRDSLDARRRRVAEQTCAVLFLATPHAGAALASIADRFRAVFGATVSIEDLKAHDAHLRDLYNWYRNHSVGLGITTRTYFELRGVGGVLPIVDTTSSQPGVGEDAIGLDEDHFSIAKPRSREDQVCRAALDLLLRHVLAEVPQHQRSLQQNEPIRLATPSPTEVVVRVEAGAPKDQPIPCQLPPAAAKRFYGRDAELEKLVTRLRAGQSTAVVGPGGLGKTALAAEALRRVVGDHGDGLAASPFRDGIVFLDLYAWKGYAEVAWNTLASSLAGGEFLAGSPAHTRATEACRGRRILVIVEGGEVADGQDGRAAIEDLFAVLSRENVRLLLTRERSQTEPSESVTLREALEPADAAKLLDALSESRLAGPLRARVLALLEGHPLAITWAGKLLARGDAPARHLVEEWEQKPLRGLSDPKKAEHTLEWLFERSVRGLDEAPRTVLTAAGLLAHAPFPEEWMTTVVSPEDTRTSLRVLVQRGFLRLLEPEERWQFGHVLAYRFARVESGSDPRLRKSLAVALRDSLRKALQPGSELVFVATLLDHAAALLRTDDDQLLWGSLADRLLYEMSDRLVDRGQLPLFQRALAAFRGWLERLPAEAVTENRWLREKGSLLNREGNLRTTQGDIAPALAAYREALEIRQKLANADPSNSTYQRDLSISHEKIGNILQKLGDLPAALGCHRDTLAIRQKLANADPSNSTCQRDLSIGHNKIGDILQAQGDLPAALAAYREALAIRQKLANVDISNTTWQRDLSISHTRIGNILQAQGDFPAALAAYRKDLAICQKLANADPSNSTWRRDISVSHNNIGTILQAQGDLPAALAAYRESLAIRQKLANADPSNSTWRRDLSASHNNIGTILQAQGDLPAALAAAGESLAISQKLADADPSNSTWQRDLSNSHINSGDILQAQGDLPAALAAYRESLAIRQQLANVDPSNSTWQRDLSVGLYRLAMLHEQIGELAEALPLAEESFAIDEKLTALDPTNATWQSDLKESRALIERLRRG